jgi:hypothetical protein
MIGRVCLAWFVLLALGGFFLGFSGSVDDAHITYWSARVLASTGELLNYNLERVEQSSALLQVLVLALLHKITGFSVVTLGHVTTVLVSLTVFPVMLFLLRHCDAFGQRCAALFLATSPFYVYWTFSGMEGPWVALLLLLSVLVWSRFLETGKGGVYLVFVSASAQIARPEMPLVSVVSAGGILIMLQLFTAPMDSRLRRPLILLSIQLCIAALIFIGRWCYFGDLWPQPVSAKTGSGLLAGVLSGAQYLMASVWHIGLILPSLVVLFSVLLALKCRRKSIQTWLLIMFVLVYGGFVIASGGDWMTAGRFWVPVIPICVVLLARASQFYTLSRHWQCSLLICCMFGHVFHLWQAGSTELNGVPLWKQVLLTAEDQAYRYSFFERHGREHLHDIPTLAYLQPVVARLQADRSPEKPLVVMAGQAGMVMYYLASDWPGRIRVIDRNGLIERTFTDCPLASAMPRTRNGVGIGYEWVMDNRLALIEHCAFVMPDLIFDIDAGWNRKNRLALERQGYVVIYYQKGHIVDESVGGLLPLRRIGAGQYVAVTEAVYEALGRPAETRRIF